MSKENDMLGRAVNVLVSLPSSVLGLAIDLLIKLSNKDFQQRAAKQLLRNEGTPQRPLRFLRPLQKQDKPEKFSTDDTFFASEPTLEFAYIGDNFRAWFSGKEEEVTSRKLQGFGLSRPMSDSEIIADLGGERAAESSLFQIWGLLTSQPKGEDGPPLTDGYWNIFYVRDTDGVLRTVRVRWRGSGWHVDAHALGGVRWGDDDRVFSSRLLPAA